MTKPSFFFSHARQDREMPGNYLRSFFDALESKLAQWGAITLQDTRIGTIDTRVPQGENWDEDLSRGLANDATFVAILTPLYFTRRHCGKELAVFVLRSPALGIDANGALTGVKNVIPIRWLPENAYAANTVRDSLIPKILRLIEDTPPDDGRDPDRTRAIERYRKKGMEKCVNVEPHYGELLDLFVERIRGISPLSPAGFPVSFATAHDAFTYDWSGHFAPAGAAIAAGPAAYVAPISPQPMTSVVAFYVTRRAFTRDASVVGFADQLVTEGVPGAPGQADPVLAALLADVRAAGVAEGLTVFHAAADPAVPANAAALLTRLNALCEARVVTALIVDPAVWPGAPGVVGVTAVEDIIRASSWTGLVLLPTLDARPLDVDALVVARGLPPRLVKLPQASDVRIDALRRAFVDARGRVLRVSTDHVSDAERLPLLKGVGAELT